MVSTDYNSPQAIIDNLHSAVVVIGEKMQVICTNPAAEMLFHISNNRAANKNIQELIPGKSLYGEVCTGSPFCYG